MGHWVTLDGPSSQLLPLWKSPWKWIAVLSFPRPLKTFILIISPMLPCSGGQGHCPLIPINGRANPSGAALTQVIFQENVLSIPGGIVGAETDELVVVVDVEIVVLYERLLVELED
jgi:hypothetical protein